MAFQKTPEQIEEEQRLLSERYPDAASQSSDLTQYDMPADLKAHAYNLFPALNEISPKSNVQIPFAPEENVHEPANLDAPEATQSVMDQLDSPQEVRQTQEQIPQESPIDAPPQEDYQQAIDQSSERARSIRLNSQMARTRDAAIGAGLGAKFEADNSMFKDLAANADEPVKELLLASELKNNKAKNDPSSQISKLVRASLSEMGMNMDGLDGVSYAQIEKIYPSLAQSLYTKLANESKREERNLMREVKVDSKASNDLDRVGQSVDRQVAQLRLSKEASSYESAKTAETLLQAALNSKSPLVKVEDAAAFMNYAKSAQGDDSVVKAEDMKVLAGGMGFNSVTEMLSKLTSKARGSSFTKGELTAMGRVLQTIKNVKRAKLQQRLTPLKYKAEMHGYDMNQSIDPGYMEEIFAPMPLSLEQKASRLRELKAKQGK